MIKTTSKFDSDINGWFDVLAKVAKKHRKDFNEILMIIKKTPNKNNLYKLIDCIKNLSPKGVLPPLIQRHLIFMALDIDKGVYSKEFRYRYHRYPLFPSQSSATGEFFSMIRQAINYSPKKLIKN